MDIKDVPHVEVSRKDYESPIRLFDNFIEGIREAERSFIEEQENYIIKAIHSVGIDVNKDELIKALQYDRNQYDKGYADCKQELEPKINSLQRRCRALSGGTMCMFCPMECSSRATEYIPNEE